jgi:hypothetical protein
MEKGREGFEARRDGQGRGSPSLVFLFVTVVAQPGHFARQGLRWSTTV